MSRGTPAISSLSMNAGDTELLDLSFFYASSTRVLPGADWAIQISVKDAEGEILAVANQWTFHPETASYRASLDLNTQELRDAFGSDAFLTAYLQLIYSTGDGEDPVVSQVVSVSIRKQVASFDDLTPTSLPTPLAWLANALSTATAKTTPVDADTLPISDSAASGGLKKLTFSNLRAWVLSWLSSYAVRHDVSQSMDADNKARAISNIGAVPEALELDGPPITERDTYLLTGTVSYDDGTGTNDALPAEGIPIADHEGRNAFSTTGTIDDIDFSAAPFAQVYWNGSVWIQNIRGTNGVSTFTSNDAVATLEEITTWNAFSGETGAESISISPPTEGTDAVPGQVAEDTTDPNDIYIKLPSGGFFSIFRGVVAKVASLFGIYNPWLYGAVGDGETDDTVAIQTALNLAAAVKGTVHIPVGVFATGPLTRDPSVSIRGANRDGSILKANAAGPLITSTGTVPLTIDNLSVVHQAWISDLTLDGNDVGDVGLLIEETQFWSVDRVTIQKFAVAGFDFHGAVGGYCTDCKAALNGIGYRLRAANPSSVYGPGSPLPPNLTGLIRCVSVHNSFRGVEFIGGCNFKLDACEIESNGTVGNDDAGGVYVKADHYTPGSHGLIMTGGWIEDSRGGFHVSMDGDSYTQHALRDVFVHDHVDSALNHAFIVYGDRPNHVVFDTVHASPNSLTRDVYMAGGLNNRQIIELRSSPSLQMVNTNKAAIRTPLIPQFEWPLNESAGTVATDISINETNGTVASPSWVAGRLAGTNALSVAGAGTYVTVPNSTFLRIRDKQLTMAAWVKISSTPGTPSSICATSGSGLPYVATLIATATGKASFSLYNGSLNPEAIGSVDIDDNVWHHICGVYDGKKARLYVDGVLDTSIETNIAIDHSPTTFRIGQTPIGNQVFVGIVSEVRYYNAALTPAQVQEIAS